MKFILILMVSVTSFAHANECKLPFKQPNNSLWSIFKSKAPKNSQIETPDGKCQLMKRDFMWDNNFTCEEAFKAVIAASSNARSKFNCYQPALGTIRGQVDGLPYTSIHAICYLCNKK